MPAISVSLYGIGRECGGRRGCGCVHTIWVRWIPFMIRKIRAHLTRYKNGGCLQAGFPPWGTVAATQVELHDLLDRVLLLMVRGTRPVLSIAHGVTAQFVVADVYNILSLATNIFVSFRLFCCCCVGVCYCCFCCVRGWGRGRGRCCHPSLLNGRTRIGRGIGIGRGRAGV